jgi:hypothetical protein
LEPAAVNPGDFPLFARASLDYLWTRSIDETLRMGFDPVKAACFEGCVEVAYLVASCDGDLHEEEQHTFVQFILALRHPSVQVDEQVCRTMDALMSDLREALAEEGIQGRIRSLGRMLRTRPEQIEALSLAMVAAQACRGVREPQQRLLEQIASAFAELKSPQEMPYQNR